MIKIRPETVQDYSAIAAVNVLAFKNRAAEAGIVALHRQRTNFDPALSLVAEVDSKIAGHVLFTPQKVRIAGEFIEAVCLAPIAVHPAYQKQGIGKKLIEAGHAIAREKSYAFSFLLGHPTYYPLLGYKVKAFGSSSLTVQISERKESVAEFKTRSLIEDDIQYLNAMWDSSEKDVDFSLEPGKELLEWLSPHPLIESTIYADEEGIAGFTRINTLKKDSPTFFLARNNETAHRLTRYIAATAEFSRITLPIHPSSTLAKGLGEIKLETWEAAMLFPLAQGIVEEYYAQVQTGERLPGSPVWSTAFDLD